MPPCICAATLSGFMAKVLLLQAAPQPSVQLFDAGALDHRLLIGVRAFAREHFPALLEALHRLFCSAQCATGSRFAFAGGDEFLLPPLQQIVISAAGDVGGGVAAHGVSYVLDGHGHKHAGAWAAGELFRFRASEKAVDHQVAVGARVELQHGLDAVVVGDDQTFSGHE